MYIHTLKYRVPEISLNVTAQNTNRTYIYDANQRKIDRTTKKNSTSSGKCQSKSNRSCVLTLPRRVIPPGSSSYAHCRPKSAYQLTPKNNLNFQPKRVITRGMYVYTIQTPYKTELYRPPTAASSICTTANPKVPPIRAPCIALSRLEPATTTTEGTRERASVVRLVSSRSCNVFPYHACLWIVHFVCSGLFRYLYKCFNIKFFFKARGNSKTEPTCPMRAVAPGEEIFSVTQD